MHTKVERVRRAVLPIYPIRVGSDLSSMRSEFLLIEPLYFRMMDNWDLSALRDHAATKILYCSEMELFRWTGSFRKELLEICDVVTCNCDYQASLFGAVGIRNPYRLIDPIPAAEFQPMPKKLQIASMGLISEIKGSPFIAALFKMLAPTPIETVYVGGAGLWGETSETDLALEAEIRASADIFHQNLLPQFVPKAIGAASFFVGNALHDVFSSCHAEALMSGCISVSGQHPIYAERFGFALRTVTDVIEMVDELTEGFKRLPDPELNSRSREWAVAHLSFETFTLQLSNLLRSLWMKDSTPTLVKPV